MNHEKSLEYSLVKTGLFLLDSENNTVLINENIDLSMTILDPCNTCFTYKMSIL